MKLTKTCLAAAIALSFGMAGTTSAAPIISKSAFPDVASSKAGMTHEVRDRYFFDEGGLFVHPNGTPFYGGAVGGHVYRKAPYYNGYRGYRHPRRGWQRHNGWWYPPAAFALGAIIGGAIVAPRYRDYAPHRVYRERRVNRSYLPRDHYAWCDGRYRTYRASDNTYIPRRGYRAECRSPFWP